VVGGTEVSKYRIVCTPYRSRFTVEIKRWWWPFWCDITPYLLGFDSRDEAKEWALAHSRAFVVEELVFPNTKPKFNQYNQDENHHH
jgi:hypothetical protein